jgi:hypothetical protein
VCTEERESVQVIVNLLNRDVPAVDSVALLAACAELALVKIGVTIGAFRSDVGENRFRVALRA